MATAKAISLSVRPTQSADLCFPVDGIIEYLPSEFLGRTVEGLDIKGYSQSLKPKVELYAPTGGIVFEPGEEEPDPVLIPDPVGDGPEQIGGQLGEIMLAKLRSEDVGTELTQLLSWYGLKESTDESSEAVKRRVELLGSSPGNSNSLFKLLDRLSDELKRRHDRLEELYQQDSLGIVKAPWTIATTSGDSSGITTAPGGTPPSTTQTMNNNATTETYFYGRDYQTPKSDNRARYLRAEIGLRQEQLAAFRLVKLNSKDNLEYQKTMSASEVRKLQLSLLDRYLMAPFDGVVTAIFRNVGDFVSTGQPVLRLENDTEIYLVGTIKCRSIIRIGYTASVTTILFGEPGASPVQLEGKVVAIRGHEPVDEQWNVIIRCGNIDDQGERILPLNYNFDFNTTDITLSP